MCLAPRFSSYLMMTEAQAGFKAFHEGNREVCREVDFVELLRRLARGEAWSEELRKAISPQYRSENAR